MLTVDVGYHKTRGAMNERAAFLATILCPCPVYKTALQVWSLSVLHFCLLFILNVVVYYTN